MVDWSYVLTALAGAFVAGVPIVVKMVLDLRKGYADIEQQVTKAKQEHDYQDRERLIKEHENVRLQLLSESANLRDELRKELLAMRTELAKLHDENFRYAIENAELRVALKMTSTPPSHSATMTIIKKEGD